MQDVGTLLKTAREEKHLTLEQAMRETNIAQRYLDALETGQYDIFPGEPYIVGFLRNYAEYLGIDHNECITLYKQAKIQEAALPPEQLLPKKTFFIPRSVITVIAGIAAIGIIIFIGMMIFNRIQHNINQRGQEQQQNTKLIERDSNQSYIISDELFEKRLFTGDSLSLSIGDKQYEFKVEKTAPELHLDTHLGVQMIALGQSLILDLNGDVIGDVKISVEDLDKLDETKGALVEIKTSGFDSVPQAGNRREDIQQAESAASLHSGKYKVLFDAGSAYPVTLNATFRSYCLFRYEQDHTNREERYYQKSEQLTIQANNGIRIWASNGNAVKMQIIAGGKTLDIEVSRPGEVIVKDLKWIKDDDTGRFRFVVIDVD